MKIFIITQEDSLVIPKNMQLLADANFIEITGTDPVGAIFILLNLLKGNTDGFTEFCLANSEANTAGTDP